MKELKKIISKQNIIYYFVPLTLIIFIFPILTQGLIRNINQDNFGGNHIAKSITETNDNSFIVVSETRVPRWGL